MITGNGRYLDDLAPPGTKQVAFVRSQHAHARITKINCSRALALPGVIAVLTGEDAKALTKPILGAHSFPIPPGEAKLPEEFYCLAWERVRYLGEPVAAVLADTRALAEDAAELIQVDYEPLPAVVDPEQAMQPDAPLVHDGWGDNIAWRMQFRGGTTDEAFARAAHVFSERFRCARRSAVPLEGRGALGHYDPAQAALTFWANCQRPYPLQAWLADLLGGLVGSVHVIAPPDIGGGFGSKANPRPEDLVVALFAVQTGQPVEWVEDRREHLQAAAHDHEQIVDLQVAVDDGGKLLGMRARIISNSGSARNTLYAGGSMQLLVATGALPNTYDVANVDWEATSVATHTAPHGAVRGFGQTPTRFAVERMMDIIADKLGIDPAELRRRNMVRHFPHTSPTGLLYDTGSFLEALDKALELSGYDAFKQTGQAEALRQGRYEGMGVASVIEVGAPNSYLMAGMQMSGYGSARVTIDPTGTVRVFSAEAPQGQGHDTTFSQVAADQLGVHPDQVQVSTGDTALAPHGSGTYGNRAGPLSLSAIHLAGGQVRQKLLQLAAHLLETGEEDLELQDGQVQVRGAPTRTLTLAELAHTAYNEPPRLPDQFQPGLEATSYFEIQAPVTVANACEVAKVRVDPTTGEVALLDYVVVHDCGRVVNPQVVEGMVHGQVSHEVGAALLERIVYTNTGQLDTTTLRDYVLPGATEVPNVQVETIESPSTLTPLGTKGMGEGAVAVAAIANAVADALSPFDVQIQQLPITPSAIVEMVQERTGARR